MNIKYLLYIYTTIKLLLSSDIIPLPFIIKIPVSSYNKDEYGYPWCHLNLLLEKNHL
jgi:hypothetical protein